MAKILVTGAGGFIGGAVGEYLHQQGHVAVGGIRRWGNAPRLARFGIPTILCDVMDPKSLDVAMSGCSGVVHCAVGDATTTVEGTRNVLEAAQRHAVQRVVHLSTVAVYGTREGDVTETMPVSKTGNSYGDAKILAEQSCVQAARSGLQTVVLRPAIVYGPFGKTWSMRYAQRFAAGKWGRLGAVGNGFCNPVYVVDLARAIALGLEHPKASGKTFNVSSGEIVTWNEYFARFARSLGVPVLELSATQLRLKAWTLEPIRRGAVFALKRARKRIVAVAASSEVAGEAMRAGEGALRSVPSPQELRLYQRKARYDISKIKAELGFEARYPLDQGLAWTSEWLQAMKLNPRKT